MDAPPTNAVAGVAAVLSDGEQLWAQQLALHNTPERIAAISAAAVQLWRDKDASDLAALNANPTDPVALKAVQEDSAI